MVVINIGDIQVPVETVQRTTPSLKMMTSDGTIYYLPTQEGACPNALKLSDGEKIYTIGISSLYYETTSINNCETVELEPGCYHVAIMGGRGGDGGNNPGSGASAKYTFYNFSIYENTTVTVFRGADGNSGTVNTEGNIASGGGGGASGVPSLFAIGDTVTISNGGVGGNGGSGLDNNGTARSCGAGGGGNPDGASNGANGFAKYSFGNDFFMCGAGGGGAASGTGGTGATASGYGGEDGANGDTASGGNGGGSYRMFGSWNGGTGGANVTFKCAGHDLTSFGGGGGGAVSVRAFGGTNLDGGNGGTGTTEQSTTSYVKIYRFG